MSVLSKPSCLFIFSFLIEVIGIEGMTTSSLKSGMLFDHRPRKLNDDDYERVQSIPKKKVCIAEA